MPTLDITKPLETNRVDYPNAEFIRTEGTVHNVRLISRNGAQGPVYSFNINNNIACGEESHDSPMRLRNKSEEVAHHYFRIWFGHETWTKDQWRFTGDENEHQFETGKQAAAKAKEFNEEAKRTGSAWRFMVKPYTEMSPNHKWREWMIERFETGEYQQLPWHDESWVIADHFAHCGKQDPFQVAFVKNPVEGVKDQIQVMTPGRYLTEYYSDKLTPQEISAWACKVDTDVELKFATTPEDFERIYTTSGLASCMSYTADKFGGEHPVRVYGAGDLELAYLERKGRIIARALVRRMTMTAGRIYGDANRLTDRLVAEGFKDGGGKPDGFVGAKLLKVAKGSEIMMPYLDWSMGAKPDPENAEFLVLCKAGEATIGGTSTTGFASGRAIMTCGNAGCTNVFSEGSAGIRYHSATGRSWCQSCSEAHLQVCHTCDSNHDTRTVTMHRRRTGAGTLAGRSTHVCQHCVDNGNATVYEGFAYANCATVVHNGVRIPQHAVPQTESV